MFADGQCRTAGLQLIVKLLRRKDSACEGIFPRYYSKKEGVLESCPHSKQLEGHTL